MEKYLTIVNVVLFIVSLIILLIAMKKESKFWIKIRWYIHELIAMASNQPSYFSLKRVLSIIAGFVFFSVWIKLAHVIIINWINNPLLMNMQDALMWASALLMMMGFYSHLTEKGKVIENKNQILSDSEVK